MSFFNDFLDSIAVDDVAGKISIWLVVGLGVKIVANLKIEIMQEDEIVLKCKKERIKVIGNGLSIVSVAKGEIEISGNVCGVVKIWVEQ